MRTEEIDQETQDIIDFKHLCSEACKALNISITEARDGSNKALAIADETYKSWQQKRLLNPIFDKNKIEQQKIYEHFSEADQVSDNLDKVLFELYSIREYLQSPDMEFFELWKEKRSQNSRTNSSGPLSRRQQQVRLLLNLAHMLAKSEAWRHFKMT